MKFIGIKKLWYKDSLTAALTASTAKAVLTGATEISNSHQGTFQYTQDDPETTDYVNELTGQVYHRDKTRDGAKNITFSIGEYDLATKAALQGGSATEDGKLWSAKGNNDLVYKCIIAELKTGNYVIFPNALINAKVDTQERGLMLGVTATALESGTLPSEYWISGDLMK